MPSDRYFIDAPLTEGAIVSLEEGEFHHLANVMRTQIGETVELVNGKECLAHAVVEKIEKKRAALHIRSVHKKSNSGKKAILAQALPRLQKLEFILEKGTELNAGAFWLFPGILSEKDSISPSQLDRLRAHIISAMKQCGRLDLPDLLLKPPLDQWEKPEGTLLFGDTRETAKPLTKTEGTVIIFIGPEKGFHPKEIEILENKFQATGVKLHDNILRVETAALVALVK